MGASAVVFDCFFSAAIAFFVGVLMEFPPVIALGGATCAFLAKIVYELYQIDLEEDDDA